MAGLGRAFEIVGIRAVVQDLPKYEAGARRIQKLNEQIATSQRQVELQSRRTQDAVGKQNSANSLNILRNGLSIERERLKNALETKRVVLDTARAQLNAAKEAQRTAIAQARASNIPGVSTRSAVDYAKRTTQAQIDQAKVNLEAAKKLTQVEIDRARVNIDILNGYVSQHAAQQRVTDAAIQNRLAQEAVETTLMRQNRLQLEAVSAAKARAVALGVTAGAAVGFVGFQIGKTAISQAAAWEKQMVKIDNLTQTTTEETARLSKELLKIGDNLPVPQTELASAAYFALSSGIADVDNALKISTKSAKLATVGLGETEDIAKFLTSTIVAYGEANLDAADASDLLISAVQFGQGEAADFANSLGRVIPVAANMGVELDEVLAVVSSLTASGLSATQATTGFLGILNQLLSPSQAAEEALDKLGLTIGDVLQGLRDDAVGTLAKLGTAFKDNPLFARDVFDETRGLNAFLSAFANNGEQTINILNKMRTQGGETERAFLKASLTFSAQSQILKNRLNRAFIEIGTVILPEVTKTLKDLLIIVTENRQAFVNFAGLLFKAVVISLKAVLITIINVNEAFTSMKNIVNFFVSNTGVITSAFASWGKAFFWMGPVIAGLSTIRSLIPGGGGGGGNIGKTFLRGAITASSPLFGPGLADAILGEGKAKSSGKASKEFDAVEQFDIKLKELESSLNMAGKTSDELSGATDEAGSAADEAANKLKEVASSFKETSEAAGQVESLTAQMKLFGEVNKEVADSFGLDANGAGGVQAYDALVREQERANNEAFELAKTMATVANAFKNAGNVAQKIVLDLSRTALEASRTAVSAIFGRPTREVAGLQLQVAEREPGELALNQQLKPQIKALEEQLDSLKDANEKQIDAINEQADAIRESADKQKEAIDKQIDNIKDSSDNRVDVLEDQLDDIKDAQDKYLELLENRIDQEEDAYDSFKKIQDAEIDILDNNIEALNEMLQGSLSAQDRAGIEANVRALENEKAQRLIAIETSKENLRALKKERDTYEEATDAQIEAIEEQIEAIKESTEAQVEALEKQREAIEEATNAQVEALEKQADALEKNSESQEEAIQSQIDAMNDHLDAYEEETQKIQDRIDMYEAEHEILQRQIDSIDETLLTEEELRAKSAELTAQIAEESAHVRTLSDALGKDLIPEVDLARTAFNNMRSVVDVLSNETLRNQFTTDIDVASERARILAAAEYEAAEGGNAAAGGLNAAADAAYGAAAALEPLKTMAQNVTEKLGPAFGSIFKDITAADIAQGGLIKPSIPIPNNFNGTGEKYTGYGYAQGGFVYGRQKITAGEDGIEAILPLTKPARAREIVAAFPPSLASQIFRGSGAGGGGVNVNTGPVTIMDPRKSTGPIGDMAYSINRALIARGSR